MAAIILLPVSVHLKVVTQRELVHVYSSVTCTAYTPHSTQHSTATHMYTHSAYTHGTRIFYESIYIHVYGCQWSPWRVPFDFFLTYQKFILLGVRRPFFRSKFAPNLKFSQSRRGYLFGRVLEGFEASNEITRDLFKRALIFLMNFAFEWTCKLRIIGQLTMSCFYCS